MVMVCSGDLLLGESEQELLVLGHEAKALEVLKGPPPRALRREEAALICFPTVEGVPEDRHIIRVNLFRHLVDKFARAGRGDGREAALLARGPRLHDLKVGFSDRCNRRQRRRMRRLRRRRRRRGRRR